MSKNQPPIRGPERAVPCMQCLKVQIQPGAGAGDPDSIRCCDQISSKNKARVCVECRRKCKPCTPVDADNQYVKAWLDVDRQGLAADPMDSWEKAYRLKKYLEQGEAAVSRNQQSQYNQIKTNASQLAKTVSLLEALFERAVGKPADYDAHLPPDHPASAQRSAKYEEELLQEVRKCTNLNDALAAGADLSSKAVEEVGEVQNALMAALIRLPLEVDDS